ncbi:hypothetical protein B296_00048288 [Ensete ventricosum]|uniref:Uncharacterized protein n=1 Tax=Ensete ventricosum TaxID=4639 RepID=A0A426YVB0_ENSVE|nr:hypothetical protein B296_00048288 [Ensete ventricosum]
MTKYPTHRHPKLEFFLAEHRFRRLFLFAVKNEVLLVRIRHEDYRRQRSLSPPLPYQHIASTPGFLAPIPVGRSLKSRAEIRRTGHDSDVLDLRHGRRDRREKKNDDEQEEVKPKGRLHLVRGRRSGERSL